MEIRLSASDLVLGTIPFRDVAAVISAGGGVAKLDVGDATFFGGRGQAALTVDGTAAEPQVSGWVSASGIDTASLMNGLAIQSIGLTGTSAVRAKIATPAENWRSILSNLAVSARFSTSGGALSGFDPTVFAEPGARPLAAGTHGGTIPFDALEAKLELVGTTIDLDQMTLRNEAGTLTASGRYFAKNNVVAVKGTFAPKTVTPASAETPTAAAVTAAGGGAAEAGSGGTTGVSFVMAGQWPDPSVTTTPLPDQ
nr:AsmA-like C-terminal region-containing protein [Jiella sonneratiae]